MVLNPLPVKAHIAEYDGGSAEHLALLAKALGHPARIQIIETLLKRQTCIGCDLVEEIGLAASTTSEHLRILKEAGLITGEIVRPRVCYALASDAVAPLIAFLMRIQSKTARQENETDVDI